MPSAAAIAVWDPEIDKHAKSMPVGSFCVRRGKHDIFRVIQHFRVGVRHYMGGYTGPKPYQIQVVKVFSMMPDDGALNSGRAHSYDANELEAFDLVKFCMLRQRLDEILKLIVKEFEQSSVNVTSV